MRAARTALMTVGVLALLWGGYVLVDTQRPDQVLGVVVWLLGAIVVHDAILSPFVFATNVLIRRTGRRIPGAVLAIVQAAVVVGAILTLVVVPEIYAKWQGTDNPTILPGDYATRLALLWVAIVALTAVIVALYYRRSSRQNERPSRTQA